MATDKADSTAANSLKHELTRGIASLALDVEVCNYILSIQEHLPDIISVEDEEMPKERVVAVLEREVSQLKSKISLLEGIEELLSSME